MDLGCHFLAGFGDGVPMTDFEINRRIAELLYGKHDHGFAGTCADLKHHADFLYDWNCTGMLLERMLIRHDISLESNGDYRFVNVDGGSPEFRFSTQEPTLQRAVALAFLKMHEGER
jgi:hypothetical protein